MRDKIKVWRGWLVFLVVWVAAVIVVFLDFYVNVKSEGDRLVVAGLEDVTKEYSEVLCNNFEQLKLAGEMAAVFLREEEAVSEDTAKEIAAELINDTSAYALIVDEGQGIGVNQDGEEVLLSECGYYEQLGQIKNVQYVYAEDDGIEGKPAIITVIPIDSNRHQRLLFFYSAETIGKDITFNMRFDGNTFSALIKADGTILARGNLRSDLIKGDNLWSELTEEKNYRSIGQARVKISGYHSGNLQAGTGEEELTIVYQPLKMNDWALVAAVNQNFVESRKNEYWYTSRVLLHHVILLLIVFVGFLIPFGFVIRRRSEERTRLLREKADTDLLTGLNNKLATERKIKQYIEENPDSLAMMFLFDIDNFKKINDTYGHAFGDEVLRTLGKQVSSVFRVTDIVGRTGGDEFVIFLKFLKEDANTLKEAKKLLDFFKNFTAGEYMKYSATASIGVAVYPADGADFESLYKAADKALYKAKQRGKNQVAFFDDRDREQAEE